MGFDVAPLKSWEEYTREFVRFVNAADRPEPETGNEVLDRIRDAFGVFSSGEQMLLAACVCAGDYAWLADELTGPRTWHQLWFYASGEHLYATAAAVARID